MHYDEDHVLDSEFLNDELEPEFEIDSPPDLSDFELPALPSTRLRARVTPLDKLGQPMASWTVVVVELDERNIAFNHVVPLTARNVVITFEKRGCSTHSLEVELTWCRFDTKHQYTSGGRFILPLGRTA
jgi:hypothetical protein